MHPDLHSFTFCEQHIVPRRIFSSFILYFHVLEAICSIDIGHSIGGLWERPHDSWCAPLTPHCTFMLLSYRMIVAANKWLGEHFFLTFFDAGKGCTALVPCVEL